GSPFHVFVCGSSGLYLLACFSIWCFPLHFWHCLVVLLGMVLVLGVMRNCRRILCQCVLLLLGPHQPRVVRDRRPGPWLGRSQEPWAVRGPLGRRLRRPLADEFRLGTNHSRDEHPLRCRCGRPRHRSRRRGQDRADRPTSETSSALGRRRGSDGGQRTLGTRFEHGSSRAPLSGTIPARSLPLARHPLKFLRSRVGFG